MNFSVWQTCINNGIASYQKGHLEEAKKIFNLALTETKEFDSKDPRIADTLNNLAAILIDLSEPEVAIKHLRKAIGIWKLNQTKNNSEDSEGQLLIKEIELKIAHACNNIGVAYIKLRKSKQARFFLKRAYKTICNYLGSDSLLAFRYFDNMGILYYQEKKYKIAEKVFLQSLEGKEKIYPTGSLETARILANLTWVQMELKKPAEAELNLKRSLSLYDSFLGLNHPATTETLENLMGLLKLVGKSAEADELKHKTDNLKSILKERI